MKRILLSTTLVLATIVALAGGPKFQKAMGEALQGYQQCQNSADFANLSNRFDRIAKAEPKEWLPKYYQAHCLIIASFIENADMDRKQQLVDSAEPILDELLKMEPNNAEVHVLHSLYYSAQLVVDPMTRGQKFGMLSGQAVQRALQLESDNPRAKIMDIRNGMGTAQFFGQDISHFCETAKELLIEFDQYEIASPLHPQWGKRDLNEISQTCE